MSLQIFLLVGEFADDKVGMATAFPVLPSTLSANEPTRLLAHVPLEDVR